MSGHLKRYLGCYRGSLEDLQLANNCGRLFVGDVTNVKGCCKIQWPNYLCESLTVFDM